MGESQEKNGREIGENATEVNNYLRLLNLRLFRKWLNILRVSL